MDAIRDSCWKEDLLEAERAVYSSGGNCANKYATYNQYLQHSQLILCGIGDGLRHSSEQELKITLEEHGSKMPTQTWFGGAGEWRWSSSRPRSGKSNSAYQSNDKSFPGFLSCISRGEWGLYPNFDRGQASGQFWSDLLHELA